jgi:glycosyltransferase involved in cell wall biosynthesis
MYTESGTLSKISEDKQFHASRPLRIAQLGPLYEPTPPDLYGGTERVVSYLTEELVRRGHNVTLFASGDSVTSARLVPGSPRSLRLAGLTNNGPALHLPMLADIYENPNHFDIIHSHLDYWCFPFIRTAATPTIVTMHGRLDLAESRPIYDRFSHVPLVSISDSQRTPLPHMNWVGTAYHGLPHDLLEFNPNQGKYLAFLGRICPEKRVDIAIDVALKSGIPLKIAAKVDVVDREYFEAVIKPKLCPDVELIGEIAEQEKSEFLGNAIALLFTIDWPEPFGLAVIEAFACGVPVITRPCGSVPEIVTEGRTGFIASSAEELVAATKRVNQISRAECRAEFEARFTTTHMAGRYEELYANLVAEKPRSSSSFTLVDQSFNDQSSVRSSRVLCDCTKNASRGPRAP